MHNNTAQIRSFLADEAGVTVVEYAIAGGMIAAIAIGAFTVLGVTVCDIIAFTTSALQTNPDVTFTLTPDGCGGAAAP